MQPSGYGGRLSSALSLAAALLALPMALAPRRRGWHGLSRRCAWPPQRASGSSSKTSALDDSWVVARNESGPPYSRSAAPGSGSTTGSSNGHRASTLA